MTNSNHAICEFLRFRLAHETLTDVAAETGISHSYICDLVNQKNDHNLTVDKLERFAHYFHVSIPDLFLLAESFAQQRTIHFDLGILPEQAVIAFVIMIFNVKGLHFPLENRLDTLRKILADFLKNSPSIMARMPLWLTHEPEFRDATTLTDETEQRGETTVE